MREQASLRSGRNQVRFDSKIMDRKIVQPSALQVDFVALAVFAGEEQVCLSVADDFSFS